MAMQAVVSDPTVGIKSSVSVVQDYLQMAMRRGNRTKGGEGRWQRGDTAASVVSFAEPRSNQRGPRDTLHGRQPTKVRRRSRVSCLASLILSALIDQARTRFRHA
ncbi:hypothetical protein CH063_12289 [Colletotrichum higginsianum]|uniref:Uncharacterized protein n=1 Tax=Colletotrichum higginsianum (strain IMI 349063) TaxID=759273 RepID=H1VPS5_COLHI|nr:hypothetical protein CH063_12289 [Colletotrichum higginsianum]